MKLIGTTTSPYVRKVRIVLNEKKIDYDFVIEDLSDPDSDLSTYNPLGKVPCLVMEDGKTLYDSSVIADYLDTATPVGKLLPSSGRARAEVKCWEALADGIMDASILVWLEKNRRPARQQSPEAIERQMKKVQAGLKAMSEQLADKPFCHGKNYSLADIAVGCALAWLESRFPEIDWRSDYPNLAALADKLAERQSFRETVGGLSTD